jgi:acyl-coenzyme A thioesterase PaaI-like protein
MPRTHPSPGALLLANWRRLAPLPFGRRLFSLAVGRTAPYTGTVGGLYTDVRPGYARVVLRDRRRIRNHLASIHAVALVNLAEMTSGVALTTALPPGVRGIVTGLSIRYRKKARGTLECTCEAAPPADVTTPVAHTVHAAIRDAAGDVVAECDVEGRLAPADARAAATAEAA